MKDREKRFVLHFDKNHILRNFDSKYTKIRRIFCEVSHKIYMKCEIPEKFHQNPRYLPFSKKNQDFYVFQQKDKSLIDKEINYYELFKIGQIDNLAFETILKVKNLIKIIINFVKY